MIAPAGCCAGLCSLASREDRSRRIGEHLAAQDDILIAGVLGVVVADAADTRDKKHGGWQHLRDDLSIVAGP